MSKVQETIAEAIRSADTSFFNEDYLKQAAAVLTALRKAGFEVVPRAASDALVDHACDNLPFGRLKQQDFVRQLYALMVDAARRHP